MKLTMKLNFSSSVFAVLASVLAAQSASASDLKECQKQIYEMFRPLETTEVRKVVAGQDLSQARVDFFHMNEGNTCGVEVVESKGYVRVVEFEAPNASKPRQIKMQSSTSRGANQLLGVKKFELIKLDENDATYADGRIEPRMSCEIKGGTVTYTTALPVYADGVKSPYGITQLKVKKSGGLVSLDMTASAYPFLNGIVKSVTSCKIKN